MIDTIVCIKKIKLCLRSFFVDCAFLKFVIFALLILSVFYSNTFVPAMALPSLDDNITYASNSSFISNGTSKNINFLQYVNSMEGFSINYTDDWRVGSLNQIQPLPLILDYRESVFFYHLNDLQGFAVYSHKLQYNFFDDLVNIFTDQVQNQKSTLDGFAITFFQKLLDKKLENFNYIKSESGEVILKNDLPARVIVFEFMRENKVYKVLTILTIKNDRVFILEYSSEKDVYSKSFNIARSFIDSFKIL